MPFDRVRETSTTTGTGPLTLAGAPAGFRAFADTYGPGSGVPFFYVVEGVDGNGAQTGEWEIGTGELALDGTLTRDVVSESSNAGNLVNFSVGTKRVYEGVVVASVQATATAAGVAAAADAIYDHVQEADPHGDRAYVDGLVFAFPPPIIGGTGRFGVPGWLQLSAPTGTFATTAGVSLIHTFWADHDLTLTTTIFEVTAGAAGTAELAIYEVTGWTSSGLPVLGDRVEYWAAIDCSTIGTKSVSHSTPMPRGRVLASVLRPTNGITLRFGVYGLPNARHWRGDNLNSGTFRHLDSAAFAFPATVGAAVGALSQSSNSTGFAAHVQHEWTAG